jgi:hypothetical protein
MLKTFLTICPAPTTPSLFTSAATILLELKLRLPAPELRAIPRMMSDGDILVVALMAALDFSSAQFRNQSSGDR